MSVGSDATRVLAVLLFTAAIVFAAGAVPSLAAHSPGGGLEAVTNGTGGAGQGGAAPSGGDGTGGAMTGGDGETIEAPAGFAGRPPAGAGDLTVPERMVTLFGSLLKAFAGGSLGGAGAGGGVSPPSDVDANNVTRGTAEATPTPASAASPTAEPTATSEDEESGVAGPGSRRVGIVVVAVVALLVAIYVYRSEQDPLAALRALPDRIRAAFVALLLGVSDLVERAVRRLGEVRSVLELPGLVAAALRDALRSLRADVRAAVPFGGAVGAAGTGAATADGESTPPARQQIRAAWRDVVEAVAPGRHRTATAGEIERDAVDRGLPAAAVGALADAFRAVEYGDRDPDERVDSATDAAATVRDHVDDDGEGE